MIGCGSAVAASHAARSSRMTSSGSFPSGRRTTPTSVSPMRAPLCWISEMRAVSSVAPKVPALCPAGSTSYASAIDGAYRVISSTCPAVSAVPRPATTFWNPAWCAMSASVYPSTITARPDFRIAPRARSTRYSERLLSKSGVAGELRYLGP